jgi:hypothetical protein
LDAEYSLHGAAPFSVGLVGVWQQPLHHTGAASSILTKRSTSSTGKSTSRMRAD